LNFELVVLRDFPMGEMVGALNFAPRRWLLREATPELLDKIASGTAVLVDVSGKWQRIYLTGPQASPTLHRAIAVESVLAGRACAAVRIFDCPCVLARAKDGFDVWVEASYAEALRASLDTARMHSTAA
jgi:sarcosine oxidase gamma subunit